MLFEVSRRLAYNYNTISVIGRNPQRFEALRRVTIHLKGNLNPIMLDYRDSIVLKDNINTSIERYGNISLVVSWIHNIARDTGSVITEIINSRGEKFRYFDILGSSHANPASDCPYPEFSLLENINYRQVVLGFKIDEDHSRWLTDEETSEGVMKAIDDDTEYSIIGTITPWEKRP